MEAYDFAVVGAGFGGLASALTLATAGQRVLLLEALKVPGGCASSFQRQGASYEAGATLFSGLGPEGLFGRWKRAHDLDVDFVFPDPAVELRAPGLRLPIGTDKAAFIDALCALPGAPEAGLRAFFAEQGRVADALWPVLDQSDRLPPFGPGAWGWHLGRAHRYAPLLRHLGRPALDSLRRHGVADWRPLRTWGDALSQITVQASLAEAEAPFALSTLDYPFRGTGHVHGGIGRLALALTGAIERAGGTVQFATRVRGLRPSRGGWRIDGRGGPWQARQVLCNLLPQALDGLLEDEVSAPILGPLAGAVTEGWTAVMRYLRLRPDPTLRPEAHHLELIADTDQPFVEGNHIFVSISGADEGRGPDGQRTVTVSTHLAPSRLAGDPAGVVAGVQARMAQTQAALAPEIEALVCHEMTASPRTWQRFTGRPGGLVGGVPRRVGLHHYTRLGPTAVLHGLWLVGDAVFPGQSTLATALGGAAAARAALAA